MIDMNSLSVVVLPDSYFILSELIDLDHFYWILTFLLVNLTLTFPAQGHGISG